jgi:hypothetical protein
MSRLSDLYKAMETLRKEGLSLNNDLELQVSELEEEIIKKEILPIVTETIAPALKQVQRELVLVVDYVPGSPISVHLSRKRNFTSGITDAKEILPDPKVEHKEIKKSLHKGKKAPVSRLKITYADGRVICEDKALKTLQVFVLEVGVERVRSLGLIVNGVPLISNRLDEKYQSSQKALGAGWYLMTNNCIERKKQIIERIAKAFDIKLCVEIM